ncbi:MAG TPA: DUF6644 family protein [Bryobacteraceae bacterium]|nr:DUF6644 family protein [Bryobacteraceae bacterium]
MLVYDPATNPLNNNEWSFPLAECFHIAAFAMSIGTISLVDLRILGLGMVHQKPSQLLKDTYLWTLAGLIITITAGMIIFTTGPLFYYYSDAFRYKMGALVVAIVYNYTIRKKIAQSDNTGPMGKLVAVGSLMLWISIVFAGLFYAFT